MTLKSKQCVDAGEMFAVFFSKFKFLVQKEPVLLDVRISAVRTPTAAFFQLPSLQGWLLCISQLVCFS